jgi:hypothetical protein
MNKLIALNPAQVRISRKRYMAVSELLKNPHVPSRRITYTELVSALYEKPDAPPWINDSRFEQELEKLMAMDIVCICRHCDSVISFFRFMDQVNAAELDLLIAYCRDENRCPHCTSNFVAFTNPQTIRLNDLARALIELDIGSQNIFAQKSCDPAGDLPSTPNEKWLFHLLESIRQGHGQPAQSLPVENDAIEFFHAAASKFKSLAALGATIPHESELAKGRFSLRPEWTETHKNLLGKVWEDVKRLITPDHSALCSTAIGISETPGFFAFGRQGPQGENAIVLGMAYKFQLANANHIVHRLENAIMRSAPEGIRIDLATTLVNDVLLRQQHSDHDLSNYKIDDEYQDVNFNIHSQLRFVLLHELAHLAEPSVIAEGNELEEEKRCDAWAIERICEPSYRNGIGMRLRAIWWLMQFWTIESKAFGKNFALSEIEIRCGHIFQSKDRTVWHLMSDLRHEVERVLRIAIERQRL